MPKVRLIAGLFLLPFLLGNPIHAQDGDEVCSHPKGRTIEDISAELAAHEGWLEGQGWKDPDIPGRANFCNANLSQANLRGANLSQANLQGAVLVQANLQEANLREANLQGALPMAANLQKATLARANLQEAFLAEANLQGAILAGANLQGANLAGANLREANLFKANLQEADLFAANLQGASLFAANLQGARIERANLQEANLGEANLQEANLAGANLRDATLNQSLLLNAILLRADLARALYQPATAPASGSLSGVKGLESVWFCPGEASGLVQLREAFKEAGLRDLERRITNTLERIRTGYALARWNGRKFEAAQCPVLERDRMAAIEGVFRLVFFEWTTAYGLAYGRPILILLALIWVFTLVYLPALLITPKSPVYSGIFRIWPQGRIEQKGTEAVAAEGVVIERLKPRGLSILGMAFYFSIVSAFHLGWRDLNVGTWIARIQPREYALRPKGWVRVVSGIQSLISVYLVAMWVLTYFGRPFG